MEPLTGLRLSYKAPGILRIMNPAEFVIPAMVGGQATWVPFSHDIQYRIKNGCPTTGWTGDSSLYVTPTDDGWAIGSLGPDGSKTLVYMSKKGQKLDTSVLAWLRDHDSRYVDVLGEMEKRNDQRKKDANQRSFERTRDGYERVVHALAKDVGHVY